MTDQLPATLLTGLVAARDRAKTAAGGMGEQYLKLEKSGTWVYGAESIDVQEGSLWAVDPNSFTEGYIAWAKEGAATVLGEQMRPATDPPVQLSELPAISGGNWDKQMGVALLCLNGEDAGTRCIFNTTAKGGIRAISELLGVIVQRLQEGETDKLVPVVTLDTDSYIHKRYGRIFTPVLTVTRWESLAHGTPEEAVKAAEVEAEKRAEAPPEAEAAGAEQESPPEPETPPKNQRRRRRRVA